MSSSDHVDRTEKLEFSHLFTMRAELSEPMDAGAGSLGRRILNAVRQGTFEGEKLKGSILPGTGDWMLVRRDGVMIVDARVVLLTDDGAIIHMNYGGRIAIATDDVEIAQDPARRHLLDPRHYYFRTTPTFETGFERYAWLNNIVCVGTGRLLQGRGVSYEILEIL